MGKGEGERGRDTRAGPIPGTNCMQERWPGHGQEEQYSEYDCNNLTRTSLTSLVGSKTIPGSAALEWGCFAPPLPLPPRRRKPVVPEVVGRCWANQHRPEQSFRSKNLNILMKMKLKMIFNFE